VSPAVTRNNMDIRIYELSALFCDQGPHQGEYRIDIKGSVYLTAEEMAAHKHFTLKEES
jgi:hypothetical protein